MIATIAACTTCSQTARVISGIRLRSSVRKWLPDALVDVTDNRKITSMPSDCP